jgi:2-oxoglutarate dehydrogenase E2 component (dihydrolipoamide succinyltransferase)
MFNFIEVDVTNIVKERKINAFEEKERREKLTTPDIHGSGCKALKDFPGLNISVDGDYIIKKKAEKSWSKVPPLNG